MLKHRRMKITEAIALEHVTLLRVFDEVERVLPRLRSLLEVCTIATILEGCCRATRNSKLNSPS